jgi:hypothetical protein
MFSKFFFPNKVREGGNYEEFSDEENGKTPDDVCNKGGATGSSFANENLASLETMSLLSSTKNKDLTNKIK